jgi:hypothetical protein
LDNDDNRFWNNGFDFYRNTGQAPLSAPSVFNFFLPDYVPNSAFASANIVAPEFQIHDSATSINYLNQVDAWTNLRWYEVLRTWGLELEGTPLDFEGLKYYAKDSEVLINQLDKLFTRGQLSEDTKQIIVTAVDGITRGWNDDTTQADLRVKMALYLLMISPDYVILK